MLSPLAAALGAALVYGYAAVLQGRAVARRAPAADGLDPRLLLVLLRDPAFGASVLLNLTGFGMHVVALQSLPLFLVQVALASSVAVTAVLSVQLLRQHLTGRQWCAVAAVCAGLALLAVSAEPGAAVAVVGAGLAVRLLVALAVLVALGALAARVSGATGAVLLGLVAGCGFGIVAVAGRLLPSLAPAAIVRSPFAAVLLCAGPVAFLLYAAAMQHGSVTLATAALVVTQTAAPAGVGLLLLGDSVRPGTLPAAALGFVVALGGALALARFEGAAPGPARRRM